MPLIKQANSNSLVRDAIVLDLGDLRRQADAIVEEAQTEAGRLLDTARAEAARITRDAAPEGRAQGIAAGRIEGERLGRAEAVKQVSDQLAELMRRWTDAIERWERERAAMMLGAREDVIALAIEIARKVVHRRIEVDSSLVVDQVESALAMVARPTSLRIAVHPADRPLVEQAMPAIIARLADAASIALVEREDIQRGGCILSTAGGEIGANISTQIDRLAESLLPARHALQAGPPEQSA
jgi:flagellar assembly protein FliH